MDRNYLQRQLIKLGDMMGDGLRHEDPSISAEYRKVAKALYPEMYPKKKRKPSRAWIKTITPCSCGALSLKMKTEPQGITLYCTCGKTTTPKATKIKARDSWNRMCAMEKKVKTNLTDELSHEEPN